MAPKRDKKENQPPAKGSKSKSDGVKEPPAKRIRPSRRIRNPTTPVDQPNESENEGSDDGYPDDGTAVDKGGKTKYIDQTLVPISQLSDMFADMLRKGLSLNPDLFKLPEPLVITVGTVCSGTEAPLYAFNLLAEAARNRGHDMLRIKHSFSCEIEGYKQAFIHRNHNAPVIFRNVMDLGATGATQAMDASGSYKPIPTEKLDYLIAGTSCVDFSSLNTAGRRKYLPRGFDMYPDDILIGVEKSPVKLDPEFAKLLGPFVDNIDPQIAGESGTTFCCTLNFIVQRRPRIVIFENVSRAPFRQMVNFWLARAGYHAEHLQVDSQNYYLPQTRLRGYVVGMDAAEFERHGFDAEKLVKQCISHMQSLERQVSAPVTEFLIPEDDPRFRQARVDMERPKLSHGRNDWIRCQTRHRLYRQYYDLDEHIRHFSQAIVANGKLIAATPPSRSWIPYFRQQPTRIHDFLDLKVQQHLASPSPDDRCDIRYKYLIFDISQNVDRNTFQPDKLGAVPIVTPSGQHIFMFSGRPITGLETLTFQGIPIDQLHIADESQDQLKNLAGNAMSVTVVGAAIFATGLVANDALATMHDAMPSPPEAENPYTARDVQLVDNGMAVGDVWSLNTFYQVHWHKLIEMIDATKMRCHCFISGSENPLVYQCEDCLKFACEKCKGNPPHSYKLCENQSPRQDPFSIKSELLKLLPGVFNMYWPDLATHATIFQHLNEELVPGTQAWGTVLRDLIMNCHYYLNSVNISSTIISIEYVSLNTFARLVLKHQGCAWYVYPRRHVESPPKFADLLDYSTPIARGVIYPARQSIDPEQSSWGLWKPAKRQWQVLLERPFSPGSKVFAIARSAIVVGDAPAPNNEIDGSVKTLTAGVYQAKPRCGTPENQLFVRTTPGGDKVYFFRDVQPNRAPIDEVDQYIFSYDIDLVETQHYCGGEVYAKLSEDRKSLQLSVQGYWVDCSSPETTYHEYNPGEKVLRHTDDQLTISSTPIACCESALPTATLLSLALELRHLPLPLGVLNLWRNGWYLVENANLQKFFQDISFVYPALKKGRWFPGPDGVDVPFCRSCCVEPPALLWTQGQPWERPGRVGIYGDAIQQRSTPLIAMVKNDTRYDVERGIETVAEGRSELSVKLGVNLRMLASRAAAHIVYTDRPRQFSATIEDKIVTKFQVEVGMLSPPTLAFTKFHSIMPTTADTTGLANFDARLLTERLHVESFAAKGKSLRDDQSRSVRWMQARESSPAPF